MNEGKDSFEGSRSSEFRIADHQNFVDSRSSALARRAGKVIGGGLVGMGAVFSLTAIGDFVTSGQISQALMHLSSVDVTGLAHHLALMSEPLRAGGGASMIMTGEKILERFSK